MPIVKYIAIHAAPMNFIDYIENGEKNDSAKFLTGLNIPTEKNKAYEQFKRTFEVCTREKFYVPEFANKDSSQKEKVRLHHYIQSFSPDDNISPEEAHEIGVEWAKKVFGEKRQILISTHIDRLHIHNHFAVAPYSLDRKHWNGNWSTLIKCRKISDKIALAHGLTIIDSPRHRNTMKYFEWLERQRGNSIKAKIQEKIDRHILDKDVQSVSDLAEKLRKENYDVKLGKFMTIKPPNSNKSFRADYLDKSYDGYTIRQLEYRINNKECEISDEAISRLSGIQREHAIQMRLIQIKVFRRKSKEVQYSDLLKSADLLNYLCENKIQSLEKFQRHVDETYESHKEAAEEVKQLTRRVDYLSENGKSEDYQILEKLKLQLSEKEKQAAKLSEERAQAAKMYKEYLNEHGETSVSSGSDNEVKAERQEYQKEKQPRIPE